MMNFDATPYLKLNIDKEGHWFQNGAEIIHPGIYELFCAALENTGDGGFQIRIGNQICRVEVEDSPFVVRNVLEDDNGGILIRLNDRTVESFDPESFWINAEGIPYCRVKDQIFTARVLRPAYYALARHIVEENDSYYFVTGGRKVRIDLG